MAVKQRARKQEDKAARRRAILVVAAKLLGRKQYHRITMAEVARRCHLAKGTLYLYFGSKEELFLAALEDELAGWMDAVVEGLATAPQSDDAAERFAGVVVDSLRQRETLVDLLPLLHTVLEQNIDPEVAVAFKRMLVMKLGQAAVAVEQALPGLAPGAGASVVLRLHALVVGLRQMSDPSPVVAQVLAQEELAPLRLDFETELRGALVAIVRGMRRLVAV